MSKTSSVASGPCKLLYQCSLTFDRKSNGAVHNPANYIYNKWEKSIFSIAS